MKSLNFFIYIGISFFIISVLVSFKVFKVNEVTMLIHSAGGLFLTLGLFWDNLLSKRKNSKTLNIIGNVLFFMGIFSVTTGPYIQDLKIINAWKQNGDFSLLSNYITLACISIIVLEIGIRDYLDKEEERTKAGAK